MLEDALKWADRVQFTFRLLIVVLLMSSLVPTLATPLIMAQTYTTITSITTFTSQFTKTVTTASPIFTTYGTSTVTKPLSFDTSPIEYRYLNGSFILSSASGRYCGTYADFSFSGLDGEIIRGTIASNSQVDFYVMSDSQFTSWSASCNIRNPLLKIYSVSSYSLTWTVPEPGEYHFIFVNYDLQRTATVTFNAWTARSESYSSVAYTTTTSSSAGAITFTKEILFSSEMGSISMSENSLLISSTPRSLASYS